MSGPAGEPTRLVGLRRLKDFVAGPVRRYAGARNFDFGPGRRGNVSLLSPYVRHRLVLEQEIVEATLQSHTLDSASKFIEEVFWRAYFKGWLEHRPGVWLDYRRSVTELLRRLPDDTDLLQRYEAAVAGNTGIDCFDAWADELVTDGYLHNHARMWFASIWVFTLGLPWQLGADFFYRCLVDGDPASNTLSWRWVCGLHTPGKTYLARASNIEEFTDNRFSPGDQLAVSAPALTDTSVYSAEPLRHSQAIEPGERFGLLVTEEDCFPESLIEGGAPTAVIGALATTSRSPLPVGDLAREFAFGAVSDAVERASQHFGVDGELSGSSDWGDLLLEWATQQRITTIATAYVPVGPVAEVLDVAARKLEERGIRLVQLRRAYDNVAWPHARRGFFKLKTQIPSILDRLAICGDARAIDRKAV